MQLVQEYCCNFFCTWPPFFALAFSGHILGSCYTLILACCEYLGVHNMLLSMLRDSWYVPLGTCKMRGLWVQNVTSWKKNWGKGQTSGGKYCNSTLSYSSMRFWIFDLYSLLHLTMFESAKLGYHFQILVIMHMNTMWVGGWGIRISKFWWSHALPPCGGLRGRWGILLSC